MRHRQKIQRILLQFEIPATQSNHLPPAHSGYQVKQQQRVMGGKTPVSDGTDHILADTEVNQRRIDEEEAARLAADTSHLDNKRCAIYIDSIKAETEKAYHCRVGYWRSNRTYMAWIPKSKIEFTRDDRRQALIPVWLAKRIGERITIRTTVFD